MANQNRSQKMKKINQKNSPLEAVSISRNLGEVTGRLLAGGAVRETYMAARTAAANPRRPTPAIPASPPVLVSIPSSVSGTTLSPIRTGPREADDLTPLEGGIGSRREGMDQDRSWPSDGVRGC